MSASGAAIVVDKSFLQGTSRDQVATVFQEFRVLMTEALFYELLTTDPNVRSSCFSKIPRIDDPVVLVQNVGPILQWEIEHQGPLTNLGEVVIQESFEFNEGLADPTFVIDEPQQAALEDWRVEVKRLSDQFSDWSRNVTALYPELTRLNGNTLDTRLAEIAASVLEDPGLIRGIYENAALAGWPESASIDNRWVLFRWAQVKFLGCLDWYWKYGPLESGQTPSRRVLENEYLDLEYCLVACLVGRLASRDKAMRLRFKQLRPDGILL